MIEKIHSTPCGNIHYWVNLIDSDLVTLVFLPGLTADHSRKLMHEIMMIYDGDKKRYAQVSGHGMKMLAEAMEKDLPYTISCPALLICGKKRPCRIMYQI